MSDMHVGGQRSGKSQPPSGFCNRWTGHDGECGPSAKASMATLLQRRQNGLTTSACRKPYGPVYATNYDVPLQPLEDSLCGEEEALAVGSFEPSEAVKSVAGEGEIPEQLRAWAQHVRGVGRSRQKAYAEALSLVQMQFVAWRDAFPVAYDAAMDAQGLPRLSAREVDMLGYFGAGYQEFLHEVHMIAKEGGR